MNAIEWYNYIAGRNGGYRVNVPYEVLGESAEDVFLAELDTLAQDAVVLDAGCGHGAVTLALASRAKRIVGYDFAHALLDIAEAQRSALSIENASFLPTMHGERLPFEAGTFDLIYSRRGPLSIVEQVHLLRPGGVLTGIHVYPIGDGREIEAYLRGIGGYTDIEVRIYQSAMLRFASAEDYAEYLSSLHLNPDYTLPENRAAFEAILAAHTVDGQILEKESKHIWRAIRA